MQGGIIMQIDKQRTMIIKFTYWLIVAGIIYIALKYILPMLTPFVVGFLVAILLKPIVDLLSKNQQKRRRIVAIITLLVFYAMVVVLVFLIGGKLFVFIKDFIYKIPGYYIFNIEPALTDFFDNLGVVINRLDPTLMNNVIAIRDDFIQTITGMVTNFSGKTLNYLTNLASSLPSLLLKLIFSIVASFFFTIDFYTIKKFLLKQFSQKNQQLLIMLKLNFIDTIISYLKAYSILITITFFELSIGFFILDLRYALQLAFLIALVDILPVLGTGGVLIPWALIEFMIGNVSFGVKIFFLYLFITVVRNVLEPKIVGQQIGLHPLLTLLCMFVGMQFFGIVGLFGLPIIATILKNLNDNGTISIIK
jgi:sporulation integral membrane protein YtvI